MNNWAQLISLTTAILLILGLSKMSSPKTARRGIMLAGWGMLIIVLTSLYLASRISSLENLLLITAAIGIGTVIAWISGKKVAMTHMPQMIALYNGMGGGAAGVIAALELLRYQEASPLLRGLALLGAFIGTVSFSGSLIAFAKLQELLKRTRTLPAHHLWNLLLLLATIVLGGLLLLLVFPFNTSLLLLFFAAIFILGVTFTLPIGGANMPIVISLFNAMTGLAVGLNGFVLNNAALVIAGTVVGASGTLLTQLMAKAMNKSLRSVLFTRHNKSVTQSGSMTGGGELKPIEVTDAAIMMTFANKVIIAPGYGMAVAQAQHKLWELMQQLQQRGVTVKFAIHPVAGRMPGHMNVLLAEAGVPYDNIFDLDEINPEFTNADVSLVIGANDVVNPSAKNEPGSPIYGMPVLDVAASQNILVVKRGQGQGFSGVENSLFTMDKARMLYGDGQEVINQLVQAVKAV